MANDPRTTCHLNLGGIHILGGMHILNKRAKLRYLDVD